MLADDQVRKLLFHGQKLLRLALFHALEGYPRPFGDDLQDIVFIHPHPLLFAICLPGAQDRLQFFFGVLFLVPHRGGALKILLFDRPLLAGLDLFNLHLELLHVRRPGHGPDARAGTRLVHDVDGLVRQEATGDVAVRQADRRFQRLVGQIDLMMLFVFRAKTLEDEDGLVDGGGLHLDRLEPAFKSRVFLDVFSIFIERRRADALHLAAAQRGFDDVGGIHGPFGRTRPDDGVQLVDEQNDVLGAADFIHHCLDPLFELAAILGACDHERKVEGDDTLVAKQFGHIAAGNFLCQTFDDRGLADARLSQQHRIVLGAAAENLNHSLDLVLAANDRVHLALAGNLGQVPAEGLERGRLDFAFLLRGRLLPSFARRRLFGGLEVGIEFLQNFLPSLFDIDVEVLEDPRRDAITFPQQAQ